MIEESELVTLVLGIGAIGFVLVNRARLMSISGARVLAGSLVLAIIAWLATILEGFLWEASLNYAEHLCIVLSSLAFAWWIWSYLPRAVNAANHDT